MARGPLTPAQTVAAVMLSATLCSTVVPSELSSQVEPYWTTPTAIGFGGLGCWAGYLAGTEALRNNWESGFRKPSRVVATIAGCIGGGFLGHRTGKEIDKLLANGEELPTGLRRGAQLGTVLTGASVASLVALLAARGQEGRRTEIGAFSALGGAIAGGIVQIFINDRLKPLGTNSSVTVAPGATGGVEVAWLIRFR